MWPQAIHPPSLGLTVKLEGDVNCDLLLDSEQWPTSWHMRNLAFRGQSSCPPRSHPGGLLILNPAPFQRLTQLRASISSAFLWLKSPIKLFYLRHVVVGSPWPGRRDGCSGRDPSPPSMCVPLAEKHLDIYFIIGICGGGTIFVIFMVLLIFYINKKKKQNQRRNGKLPPHLPTSVPLQRPP